MGTARATVVDSSYEADAHNAILRRVWHVRIPRPNTTPEQLTIRAVVRCNSYERQSTADVAVLTPALTWTKLAETPPAGWHSWPGGKPDLAPVADALLRRAVKILGGELV